MAIIKITYPAKCKHCSNLERVKVGKMTRHKCKVLDMLVTLNDFVCKGEHFKL